MNYKLKTKFVYAKRDDCVTIMRCHWKIPHEFSGTDPGCLFQYGRFLMQNQRRDSEDLSTQKKSRAKNHINTKSLRTNFIVQWMLFPVLSNNVCSDICTLRHDPLLNFHHVCSKVESHYDTSSRWRMTEQFHVRYMLGIMYLLHCSIDIGWRIRVDGRCWLRTAKHNGMWRSFIQGLAEIFGILLSIFISA